MDFTKAKSSVFITLNKLYNGEKKMNEVFIIAKVIEKVQFQFVYDSKKTAIAQVEVKLWNKSRITLIGYDEMADYMYRNLKENDIPFVNGKINSKMQVEVYKLTQENV